MISEGSIFFKCARSGKAREVGRLIREHGSNQVVNCVSEEKQCTALHFSAEKGHVDVAKVLLRNGADVNAVQVVKRTALHLASENGHVDVAKLLIQNGADVNAVDDDEKTALHYVAENGRVDLVNVLIQNGADVNAVTKYKSTALQAC